MTYSDGDIAKILISEDELKQRIAELGKQITEDYRGKNLLLICILKGSIVFMADLMRQIDLVFDIDFMSTASYGSGTTSNEVRLVKDLNYPCEGKDVLIIEDILDSGKTLLFLKNILQSRNPASFKICTLLNKPERREVEIDIDYVGFKVPDEFVVGYGLDYAEKYRNLPYIGVLLPKVYEK